MTYILPWDQEGCDLYCPGIMEAISPTQIVELVTGTKDSERQKLTEPSPLLNKHSITVVKFGYFA